MLRKREEDAALVIDDLIATLTGRLKRRFKEAVENVRSQYTLRQIVRLMESGRVEDAIRTARASYLVFADQVNSGFIFSGERAGIWLSNRLDDLVSFDRTNERAVQAMRRRRLELVRQITDEQRRAIRVAIDAGVERGANPIEVARDFRETIGLTERQAQAVANYRRLLEQGNRGALDRALRDRRYDRRVRRAIDGEALSPEQIDRMVERYRQRYIKYRSEVIARTESLAATHEGTEEALQQAVDSGHVNVTLLERSWVTAGDERVRGSHASMSGQKRRMGEAFLSGNGYQLRFPGDPRAPISEIAQCRCVLTTRMRRSETAALAA